MDARINLRGNTRADIEIHKFRNKDELSRALFYLGGLLVDYRKGLKKQPKTMSIVVFICNFDPFLGTPYEGMTRMRYTLKSGDDNKFHTVGDAPYPFEGVNVLIHNGAKKWNNDKPKSIEEENVRIYLEDMQKKDPRDMKSKIASDAVNEYKGDPYIMDKTRKWAEETYKDQLKEEKNKWNEVQKKKMGAQKKKYEGKLTSQKQQYEEKIVDLKEENNRNLIDQKTQIAESLLSS